MFSPLQSRHLKQLTFFGITFAFLFLKIVDFLCALCSISWSLFSVSKLWQLSHFKKLPCHYITSQKILQKVPLLNRWKISVLKIYNGLSECQESEKVFESSNVLDFNHSLGTSPSPLKGYPFITMTILITSTIVLSISFFRSHPW